MNKFIQFCPVCNVVIYVAEHSNGAGWELWLNRFEILLNSKTNEAYDLKKSFFWSQTFFILCKERWWCDNAIDLERNRFGISGNDTVVPFFFLSSNATTIHSLFLLRKKNQVGKSHFAYPLTFQVSFTPQRKENQLVCWCLLSIERNRAMCHEQSCTHPHRQTMGEEVGKNENVTFMLMVMITTISQHTIKTRKLFLCA